MSFYIDTHFHLFLNENPFNYNVNTIVSESIKAGIKEMWLASTNKIDIEKNINFCNKYPDFLKAWIGWHPEDYKDYDENFFKDILQSNLNETNKSFVVGIGEIGVDLQCHDKSSLMAQQDVFKNQVDVAHKYNLPFAVHSRNAIDQTIEVLQDYKQSKFIWHCYNLDCNYTEKLLSDFPKMYFGLNAIITYNSGKYIEDSLKIIPNDKILLETDAPFLAPRPFKHKYNTPEGVKEVYKTVAKVKGVSINTLQDIIFENIKSLKN